MRSLVVALCSVVIGCESPDTSDGNDSDVSPDTSSAIPDECLSGHACELDDDCPNGHRCNTALDAPMCQRIHCGPRDSICDDSTVCADGMRCNHESQRCLSGAVGSPCTLDQDCQAELRCPDITVSYSNDDKPHEETADGSSVRWETTDMPCIAMTYDPALESMRDSLLAAITIVIDPSCTELCFEDPVASEARISNREVHFAVTGDGYDEPQRSYDLDTGVMVSAVALVSIDGGHVPTVSDFVKGLSWSLAFDFEGRDPREDMCDWYPAPRCR